MGTIIVVSLAVGFSFLVGMVCGGLLLSHLIRTGQVTVPMQAEPADSIPVAERIIIVRPVPTCR